MPYPSVFLIHPATVHTRTRKKKLLYDGGTAAFTEGKTVKGGTSNATGVIDKVSGTVVSGHLVLITVSGTFQNDEVLTETAGTGAAVANGTLSDYSNSYNQPEYYWVAAASTINVRFGKLSGSPGSSAGAIVTSGGEILLGYVAAAIPNTTVLNEYDQLSTTATGWSGTYNVLSVSPVYEAGNTVSHYRAMLKAVNE